MPASDALSAQLDGLLHTWQSERRLPSVSAAAFRGGELLWQRAIGVAETESGTEATVDTQYRVGSITKTFTAVAVMQLRDAGELSLDDTLGDHLPESPHAGPTIRSMLAHLSGLQREPPGEIWETLEDPTVDELLERLPQAERVLPPGAYWHYSNLAYALLGELVARRSGTSATAYVGERILGPLGLARTTWVPAEPFARGYLVEPYSETLQVEKLVELRASAPIGQLWSTTADLARWGAFLAEGDEAVLADRSLAEMHAFQSMVPYVKGWRLGWGLGLELFREGERIYAGHGGAMPGFLANVIVSREDKIGAVALTNAGSNAFLDALTLRLAGKVAELEPTRPEPWQVEDAVPDELAGVLGRWWSEGTEYVFRFRGGKLEAILAADVAGRYETTTFEPDGPDRYRAASGLERGELLRVVRDEAGTVEKLYWATYPFTREPQTFGGQTPDVSGHNTAGV